MWSTWMGAILSGVLLLTPADSLAAGSGKRAAQTTNGTKTSRPTAKTATTPTRKATGKKSTRFRRKTNAAQNATDAAIDTALTGMPPGVVKLKSTTAATLSSFKNQWFTRWESGPHDGVTMVTRRSAKAKVGNADRDATVYTGTVYSTSGPYWRDRTIGQLTFEPLPGGQHRVVLVRANSSHEVLPSRQSDGPAKEKARASLSRKLNQAGITGNVNTVEFFKAKFGSRGRFRYFAVYGEQGLKVPGKRRKETLTHIIDISSKKVASLPYNFISVWNGNGAESMVLVEPLNKNGTVKRSGGEVLGIPIAKLASDFDKTVSDPSVWTKVL